METKTAALTKKATLKKKIAGILAQKKINVSDIEDLSPAERDYLADTCTQTVEQLTDTERDNFLDKIDLVIPASIKSSIWEYNHVVITDAIAKLMQHCGVMPPKTAIAEETGLSRQTITKHLKEYKAQPEFIAQMEEFKFMAPQLLASVFKHASNGDIRAARLYFEAVGAINKKQNTVVNEQNNYIQINNTILSQENLKQLTARQLNQIEKIITKYVVLKNARAGEAVGEAIRI